MDAVELFVVFELRKKLNGHIMVNQIAPESIHQVMKRMNVMSKIVSATYSNCFAKQVRMFHCNIDGMIGSHAKAN